MTTLTEGRNTAEFLLSEANGKRSRETVTIVSGQDLAAGTVLGKITATGKYAGYDADAATGIETAVAVLYEAVDATGGDQKAVAIMRDAEVSSATLTWVDVADAAAGATDLAAVGIFVR